MIKIFILISLIQFSVFGQETAQFVVEWDKEYWHRPMIQYKYSEWPQKSIIEIKIINNNQIQINSINGTKFIYLRNDQTPYTFLNNPNLLKRILFGMREDNSMVNIYHNNVRVYSRSASPRIKGALNPNVNYLPESLKY